jgi:hypothetical protein
MIIGVVGHLPSSLPKESAAGLFRSHLATG